MVILLRRRAMMVEPAPVVEPNVTITEFTGDGTNSATIDLGMSNPSILMLYAYEPLDTGSFWNNDNGYRIMQLADADYPKDLYANTTTNTGYGGRLGPASTALLVYSNGVLSTESSAVFRSGHVYRVLSINPTGSQAKKLAIATFTGNGNTSISVDLGNINPSILLLYATTPMNSGTFPSQNNGQRLFMLQDDSIHTDATMLANTRSNTSTGYYVYAYTSVSSFNYSNGTLTVGASTVLRNNYPYKVIAIE